MNEKRLQGMMSAPPDKRYKSFLTTVADLEEVWLLSSEDGYATFDADGYIHLLVWPRKEFAELFKGNDEEVISMEIHEFVEQCKTIEENVRFMVFPTNDNSYVVDAGKLVDDINAYLEEVE